MTDLRQDLGYALRVLRRAPGFTLVATATLGLGIGASTAIFSVVDSVLLRPLRFADPQQLTMLRTTAGSRFSPAYLREWRRESRTFQDIAGWHDVRANQTGRGEPIEVLADRATANFFSVLGTPAFLGRTFTTATNLSDARPEVVLSYGLWQRRYGGDPAVIGQPITLDGETLTIVGVMPQGFAIRTNELAESRAELWLPMPLVPGNPAGIGGFLNVVGRLARGVTPGQAQAELSAIARRIEEQHPSYSRDWGVEVVPLLEATVKDVRLTLLVLFGAVGILLLIACANVANLVLGRGATRQTELAIRLSLGATRRGLVRQFLTESLVLAMMGGALGLLLAAWGTDLLVSAIPPGLELPRAGEIHVDLRVLMFAVMVSLLAAVFFALVPAVSSARSAHLALGNALHGPSALRSRNVLGGTLIIPEVALALVLLAAAGLLGRSFWKLTRVEPGFEPERVLTMRITLPASRYDTEERIRSFSRELLARAGRVPGVRAIGLANYLPLSGVGEGAPFEIEGRSVERPEERPGSWVSVVGGRYFEAMGIRLLRGRLPGEADTEVTEPVFVIDEALAHRLWPNEDPIGERLIWRRGGRERLSGEIIGVVGSVRWAAMAADPIPTTYFWFPQDPRRELTIVARTDRDPAALAGVISAKVRGIDPNQPAGEIRAMQDLVSADLARARFTMLLLGGFAAAALFLAGIGLYGVIAFWVTQRTREVGIRVALGAQHGDVLQLVMHRGILLTGTGLAIGIAAALGLGRLVSGVLYDVTPADPASLLAAALFLTAVALVAMYLPARRATRVDPIVALGEGSRPAS